MTSRLIEMAKTVAEYRKLAREAEKNLEWEKAVEYWKLALAAYADVPGELAEADRDKITTAINADEGMIE